MAKKQQQRQKILGIPLNKEMQKTEKETVLVRGYFTSDNKDEVGDIITRAATERAIPKYRQWGNIRLMHQPIPVGLVRRIGEEDGLEWNELEIEVIDPHAVFMVENGLLSALSVGIFIKFDDIDFLEDGGLVINDYTLAEISLVDHPANYDATLKDVPVDQGLQLLIRQYGFDAVALSVQNILEELPMPNEQDEQVEMIEEKQAEVPVFEAPVEEVPAVTEEVEKDIEGAVEAAAEEEPVEPEPVAEEPSAPELIEAAMNAIKEFTQAVNQAVAEIKRTIETQVEAPKAEEQAEGETEAEKEAALVASQETPADQVSEAVDRKGAVPETVLPDEQTQVDGEKPAIKDLRGALRNYFITRNK